MNFVSVGILVGAIFVIIDDASTAPVNNTKVENYLKDFGHLNEPPSSAPSELQDPDTAMRNALRSFQSFAGIPVTGEPDAKTLEMMALPRCAVADNTGHNARRRRRRKRYDAQGSKWPDVNLRYYFENTTKQLSASLNKEIVKKAFQFWMNASTLVITETLNPNSASIKLLYAVRAHGDAWPFNGRGGVLAHAFYPDSGGDAHFDDDEIWTYNTSSGTNLLQVTTHELGHSLGLGHSSVPGAVMAPFYTGYNPGFSLSQDDIDGIRFIYGYNNNPATSTTTSTSSTSASTVTVRSSTSTSKPSSDDRSPMFKSFCSNGTVDAIVFTGTQTLAFQGSMYAVLDVNGVLPGYPRLIRQQWPDLPDNLDSALYLDAVFETDSNGNNVLVDPAYLFFFKGDQYWRYRNTYQLDSGYPKRIGDGFPGIPNVLDAGFVWSGNGRTYFIKGEVYYAYTRWRGADSTYPRTMAVWRGLPRTIDSAFQWQNGRTYFFSGTDYYRFNDIDFYVDNGYPKSIASSWFNCAGTQNPSAQNLMMEQQQAGDQFRVVTMNPPEPMVDSSNSSPVPHESSSRSGAFRLHLSFASLFHTLLLFNCCLHLLRTACRP